MQIQVLFPSSVLWMTEDNFVYLSHINKLFWNHSISSSIQTALPSIPLSVTSNFWWHLSLHPSFCIFVSSSLMIFSDVNWFWSSFRIFHWQLTWSSSIPFRILHWQMTWSSSIPFCTLTVKWPLVFMWSLSIPFCIFLFQMTPGVHHLSLFW